MRNDSIASKKISDIASNPMYRLNQPKNLNNMFDDDDDQDDDFGNDLFKAGNKKVFSLQNFPPYSSVIEK